MDYLILNETGIKKAAEIAQAMRQLTTVILVLMGVDVIALSLQLALIKNAPEYTKLIDLSAVVGAASILLVVLTGVLQFINSARLKRVLHGTEYNEGLVIPPAVAEEAEHLSNLLWELTGVNHQHASFRAEPYRLYRNRMLALQAMTYNR